MVMKIIYNKWVPFKGFSTINVLGLLLRRTECGEPSQTTLQHEAIHSRQQWEIIITTALICTTLGMFAPHWWYGISAMLLPLLLYVLFFVAELILPPYSGIELKHLGKSLRKAFVAAYYDNCFEREAYANETNEDYLAMRPPFAWVKYVLKKSERS